MLNKTVQNIINEYKAEGTAGANCTAVIRNTELISSCPGIDILNQCTTKAEVTSEAVFTQAAEAIHQVLITQDAQNGMFRFLNFNSSMSTNQIDQNLRSSISNKCSTEAHTNVLIEYLRILITATGRDCAQYQPAIRVYNIGAASAQCTLRALMNQFTNAEINVTVEQKSGGGLFDSCGNIGSLFFFIILIMVFLFFGAVILFFFHSKRKNKDSKPSKKTKKKTRKTKRKGRFLD